MIYKIYNFQYEANQFLYALGKGQQYILKTTNVYYLMGTYIYIGKCDTNIIDTLTRMWLIKLYHTQNILTFNYERQYERNVFDFSLGNF